MTSKARVMPDNRFERGAGLPEDRREGTNVRHTAAIAERVPFPQFGEGAKAVLAARTRPPPVLRAAVSSCRHRGAKGSRFSRC